MGVRREARERAVQFLFQCEQNPPENLDLALEEFWRTIRLMEYDKKIDKPTFGKPIELPPPSVEEMAVRAFADQLIRGVLQHLETCDETIKKYLKNWDFNRIALIDRNIMRLAVYEMLFRDDIPPVVSINEAVDIAKKYSTEDSGKFVNGILDKVKADVLRPSRQSSSK
ncbi:MAG: transcription antitermination factor NusB [Verrucomicrobiia bacterium]|jgi:N utilization substance protein B